MLLNVLPITNTNSRRTNKKVNGAQTWKQTFGYDLYGNRNSFYQIIGSQVLTINNLTLPTVDANTNRFNLSQGYGYDKNGNVTTDPASSGRTFIFDGDNKRTQVKDSTNATIGLYSYDGNGKRVKKVTNLETTIFVYDGLGKLVAEYSTATPPTNPTINYTATDQLGSPRVLTDKLGQVVSRRDFMPFGEELFADGTYRKTGDKYSLTGQDAVRQRFTAYQKDLETGLDFAEARYYNDQHGRFTAVDPLLASGKSANPQTFNRYLYCLNNPLLMTDPDGMQAGAAPRGKWYKPNEPDGVKPYLYRPSQPENYSEVTERNKSGTLIGSGVGLDENFVVAFNPLGPMGVMDAAPKDRPLTKFDTQGWDVAYSDTFLEKVNNDIHPGLETAITVLDVALAFTPMKFSAIGKGVMEGGVGAATEEVASSSISGVNLSKSLASEAQMSETGTVIAGPGSSTPFRGAAAKAAEYGGNPGDYVKKSSSNFWAPNTKGNYETQLFETHWVENTATGARFELKTKFPLLDK